MTPWSGTLARKHSQWKASPVGSPGQGRACPSAKHRGAHGDGCTKRCGGTNGVGSTSARSDPRHPRPASAPCHPSAPAGAAVPGELPARRAGSIPSISREPPNITDIPQDPLQDVPAIKSCVANSQGCVSASFPSPALVQEAAALLHGAWRKSTRHPAPFGLLRWADRRRTRGPPCAFNMCENRLRGENSSV